MECHWYYPGVCLIILMGLLALYAIISPLCEKPKTPDYKDEPIESVELEGQQKWRNKYRRTYKDGTVYLIYREQSFGYDLNSLKK